MRIVAFRQQGTSLIEIMMAVLVFSIGLIGLAGLMVMAARSNQAAYLRTQVTFLASNMANRMSANAPGVWKGSYNSSHYPLNIPADDCANGAACDSQALALHDQKVWSSQLKSFLPNPKASVHCSGVEAAGSGLSLGLDRMPPYAGSCRMTISWSGQSAGDGSHRGRGVQTLAWEFQP